MAIDLKSQLGALVSLQQLDSEIYALNNEKTAKPQEIKALEEVFESKKRGLAELEKKSLDVQKQRKGKELELVSNAEAVKKLQGQLYSLKTNKEFAAMQQQISDATADGAVIEEQIILSFDESDKIKAQVEAENVKLKEEENKFTEQKKKVDERIKEIDNRLSQLKAQREQIIPQVEKKMLGDYERILQSRQGLAIAVVKDDSCGGCHMHVPPQVINLIKMYDHIITCEMCNRILYIEDEE